MKIIQVPNVFQPTNRIKYPSHNDMTLEEYCFERLDVNIRTRLSYVPIYWTTYFSRNDFAGNKVAVRNVHEFCNNINEPWFTISQYDDGILLPHGGVEFHSFNAGGVGDIPIPLTCYAWPDSQNRREQKYLASFVGNLRTCQHKTTIRDDMVRILGNEKEFYFYDTSKGGYDFLGVMLSSKFALCPRGWGRTSFRMYEAMQMGTIPVYISDCHWLPFQKYVDWKEFSIIISGEEMGTLAERLRSYSPETTEKMSQAAMAAWREYFSYDGCVRMIKKILEEDYE